MKRLIVASVLAIVAGLAAQQRACADSRFNIGCGFNLCWERTSKSRCFSYSSCSHPLPPSCFSYTKCTGGPAPFDALHAYGPALAAPAAVYAAPAAVAVPSAHGVTAAPAAPEATMPYVGPQPTPEPGRTTGLLGYNGMQQVGYYQQTGYGINPVAPASTGYAAGYGTAFGYSYGTGYFQAPSYWYGD